MSEAMKVADLNPSSRRVNVKVRVVNLNPAREVTSRDGGTHQVAEALVGDDSGSVLLTLWDDAVSQVQANDSVAIENGYVSMFRGSMRLNIGRFGTMKKVDEELPAANTENNISEKQFGQQYPRFKPYYGGGREGRGRGRF